MFRSIWKQRGGRGWGHGGSHLHSFVCVWGTTPTPPTPGRFDAAEGLSTRKGKPGARHKSIGLGVVVGQGTCSLVQFKGIGRRERRAEKSKMLFDIPVMKWFIFFRATAKSKLRSAALRVTIGSPPRRARLAGSF